ncbi:MAG TPA: alpha/beta hydrolase [Pilimelia sp.]|nr:alpha/beta hydrolase [Pilimelia sp.]
MAVVVVMMVGVLWSLQRRLIYFPDPATPPPAAAVLPGSRDVTVTTADGLALAAWLVPPREPARQVAVLVANGNAGNRRDRAPLAASLADQGFTVLVLDYRGYGGNPGSPSEAGLALDARAGWAYVTGDLGFRPGRVILFGESLGAAVATGLAAGQSTAGAPPGGLALRSPFVSLAAVGRAHYPFLPVGTLLRDRYPVADQVQRVPAPTAVVYGTADGVVPPAQSRAVAARVPNPVAIVAVDGADHNDPELVAGPAVVGAVVTLAGRLTD